MNKNNQEDILKDYDSYEGFGAVFYAGLSVFVFIVGIGIIICKYFI